MDILQAVILSVVEGVTEFLPISSTAHQVLTAQLLSIPQTQFVKSFEIFIQLGAILAVIVLYWRRVLKQKEIWKRILIAFLPTAIVGLLFYKIIKEVLIGNIVLTLWAIFLGGILLISLELLYKEKQHHAADIKDLSYRQSFLIGLIQALSVVPGVSRAGATIVGALMLGAKRAVAVEFSFLLAVPTLLSAASLDLMKMQFRFSFDEWLVLMVGFGGAFVSAMLVIKWFLKFVSKNNFISFGVYRIILAIAFGFFFLK
ncbi:MAG: undecaprenyl-diphosphatase UppP [Candidatus Daviesbacteria bacterium]|nr:MAG: undecaprenyl-diphosphatase UppP [Candidatus Daviesbacteria bacterium]